MQPQTFVVQQANPAGLNYGMSVQQPAPPGAAARFNGVAGASTGWIQLCCGIASIIVGIAQLVLSSYLSILGFGIWAGVLFYIPTGILGICSGKKNTCVVVAYMVMSILSALTACSMLITESISATWSSYFCFNYFTYDYDCPPDLLNGRVAADSILAIIGLIEMVVAIVGSAYCCGGVCCGQPTTSTQYATTVVTQPGTPMVVTTGTPYPQATPYPQTQPPMVQPAFAQPPPYNVQHTYPQVASQPSRM